MSIVTILSKQQFYCDKDCDKTNDKLFIFMINQLFNCKFWCREPESNRHGSFTCPTDFKSVVSTNFTIPATARILHDEGKKHYVFSVTYLIH